MTHYIYFYSAEPSPRTETYQQHVFSQFYQSDFTDDSGATFRCAEQYMMVQKARTFGDSKSEAKIMKAVHSRTMKALGRKVSPFDPKVWDARCQEAVYEGNYLKFSQDPELRAILLNTGEAILAEAAARDRRWGIGLGMDQAKGLTRKDWRGTNWLGVALMRVRDQLRAEDRK